MDKKAIFHLALRDVLNIGPKVTKTKSITKVRTDDRRRTVESIGDPPEITRGEALRRVRTSLNQWRVRVYDMYEKAWEDLSYVPLDDEEFDMTEELVGFDQFFIEVTLVLLLFEKNGWSVTHFRNGDSIPTDELPEWEIWFKILMDNVMKADLGDPWVFRKVKPSILDETLSTFIRRTMNQFRLSKKYDVKTLLEAARMLTVIGSFSFEKRNTLLYFDEDADGIFDEFLIYLSDLQEDIGLVEWILNQIKDLAVSKYSKELSKQSRGEKADFTRVWELVELMADVDMDQHMEGVDTVFERNDSRLWVFNNIEKFISEDDRETYHDITLDQLEKMWELFISNVLDNVKDKKPGDVYKLLGFVTLVLKSAESVLL
jgi:hypothetical protein